MTGFTCPPGHLYVCPTALEVESGCHRGFDTCCDRPDLHIPLPDGPATDALSEALSEAAKERFKLAADRDRLAALAASQRRVIAGLRGAGGPAAGLWEGA